MDSVWNRALWVRRGAEEASASTWDERIDSVAVLYHRHPLAFPEPNQRWKSRGRRLVWKRNRGWLGSCFSLKRVTEDSRDRDSPPAARGSRNMPVDTRPVERAAPPRRADECPLASAGDVTVCTSKAIVIYLSIEVCVLYRYTVS